ncbi:PDR/VanB family oxidoreductase [Ramlibacter alkalitolerans]|uniref:Oxidoreductase n=1 Tax=Ramlibacter alkalitolerans TaxID=2039631 RepID=A0ABS1JJZ4_9BURK|nr:PDR/VanB family oxidoreductase [Ramlibacter alkalitolerans]MBL0424542.1 oxidoreductase [Ramlibacter alkalitolerans]
MQTLNAFVHTLRFEAEDTITVDLRPVGGGELPAFTPGSHIELHLPNGLERSYSLCNNAAERHRYVVGVLKDRASRGGSRCVHEQLRIGTQLVISAPRNNFPLQESAEHTVLVAGGIGITPLLCMARRLHDLRRPFELLYFARSRRSAAFLDELKRLEVPLHLHFDDEQGGPPDLKALLAARPAGPDRHLYACGPTPMLDAFEKFSAELGHENAHIERFAAVEHKAADDARATFTVELARSRKTFTITPEKSILDTLLEAGVDVDHSCKEGICGSCETRVLCGEPDHRDSVLSAKERAANKVMMVCVSGCRSASVTLDL